MAKNTFRWVVKKVVFSVELVPDVMKDRMYIKVRVRMSGLWRGSCKPDGFLRRLSSLWNTFRSQWKASSKVTFSFPPEKVEIAFSKRRECRVASELRFPAKAELILRIHEGDSRVFMMGSPC